jgi:hypothetical protein
MANRPTADLWIAPLGEAQDRASFNCGMESVERYLKT